MKLRTGKFVGWRLGGRVGGAGAGGFGSRERLLWGDLGEFFLLFWIFFVFLLRGILYLYLILC